MGRAIIGGVILDPADAGGRAGAVERAGRRQPQPVAAAAALRASRARRRVRRADGPGARRPAPCGRRRSPARGLSSGGARGRPWTAPAGLEVEDVVLDPARRLGAPRRPRRSGRRRCRGRRARACLRWPVWRRAAGRCRCGRPRTRRDHGRRSPACAVADPGAGRFPAFALHELEGAFDQVARLVGLPWRRRIEGHRAAQHLGAFRPVRCEAEVDSPPAPRSGVISSRLPTFWLISRRPWLCSALAVAMLRSCSETSCTPLTTGRPASR